jgi:hypothetical protein
MQPDTAPPTAPDPARGLPPVVPPTGGFIAQLFLVPGLIVAGAVLLLLGLSWLVGGARTPEQFLKNLDNANPEVRWRAADDLAQVLLRDEHLASDPHFALDVADRLAAALDGIAPREKAYAARAHAGPVADADRERKELDEERNYIVYLLACASAFRVPAAVPLLRGLAETPDAAADADAALARADSAAWASRQREALWALAKLGDHVQHFDEVPEGRRQAVLHALEEEAAGTEPGRAGRARAALVLLGGGPAGGPRLEGLDATFAKCAATSDPFLRKTTAVALNFWEGNAAENARLEETLFQLAHDDGRGPDNTRDAADALEIRKNATAALARRGSDRADLDLLGQMLDEDRQRQDFRPGKKDVANAGVEAARAIALSTLKAVAELHQKNPRRDLSSLVPAVEKLSHSPVGSVRSEAEHTLKILGKS